MYQKTLPSFHLCHKECRRRRTFLKCILLETGQPADIRGMSAMSNKVSLGKRNIVLLYKRCMKNSAFGRTSVRVASPIWMPASTTPSSQQVAHKPVASDRSSTGATRYPTVTVPSNRQVAPTQPNEFMSPQSLETHTHVTSVRSNTRATRDP